MALHFVSTSVLSSSDGIAFEKEEKKDSEEVRSANAAALAAKNKPLFEQLEAIKAKKQEEYDANTKLIFAPPRAVDEEDEQFFQSLHDTKAKRKEAQRIQEDRELANFRDAVHHKAVVDSNSGPVKKIKIAQKENATATKAAPLIVRKRKVDNSNNASEQVVKDIRKVQKVDTPLVTTDTSGEATMAHKPTDTMLSLMSGYGSDSQDDN